MKGSSFHYRQLWIVLLVLILLAGCGGDPTPTVPTTAGPTTIASTTAAPTNSPTTASIVQPNPPGTLPITVSKVTLNVIIAQSPLVASYKYGENAFTTWLEDRTGVSVDFILYPDAEYSSKMSYDWPLFMEPRDVALMRMERRRVESYGAHGYFQPLNEPIRQYGYHIQSLLTSQPGLRAGVTAYDGSIYGLPMPTSDETLDPDDYGMRMWIHRGFLEAYGQGMPATTEEFRLFLEWVRDADANGNGDPDDEVGWTGSEKATVLYARPTDFLMNAFTLQDGVGFYVKNDTIHCAMVEDGYRNGLRYLAGLMADGLMDPDYPNNDEKAIRQLVGKNGGDTVATVSTSHLSTLSGDPEIQAKYIVVPPLAGPDGFTNAYCDYFAGVGSSSRNMSQVNGTSRFGNPNGTAVAMIPTGSSRPAVAMAWLDALYDPEVLRRAEYGVPGADWSVPAAGTVAVDGGPTRADILKDIWGSMTTSIWGTSFPLVACNGAASLLILPAENHTAATTEYQAARAYEPYVIPCSLPPLCFDEETATKANEWRTNINDYTRSLITDFIFGNLDVNSDEAWTDYTAQARGLGLTEYLAAMQSSYDKNWSGRLPALYTPKPQRVG